MRRIGEMGNDVGERDLIDLTERGLDVAEFQLEMGVQRVVNGRIADPFRRRPQLIGQVLLDGRLQCAEALEAELGGQPHHCGRSRSGTLGKIGDRSECHQLRVGQHHLGDAPLGVGETGAGLADAIRHLHDR
jgi:hypothetical protein